MNKPFFSHTLYPFLSKRVGVTYITDSSTYEREFKTSLIFTIDEIMACYLVPRNLTALHIELYKRQVRDSYKLECNSWTTAGSFKLAGEPIMLFGFGRAVALDVFKQHKIRKAYLKLYYED